MKAPFPFGYPGPTAMYLVLYVATLALHVLFMNYVLAGSFTLVWEAIRARGEAAAKGTVRYLLKDWMPFALGLAITAGVAPLLFLQILYEERFYSANLLLYHRWMMIVPALIAGFYLLYLQKTDFLTTRPRLATGVTVAAFGCFAFVAWSWTENHLLSRDAGAWVTHYASGRWIHRSAETAPRLAMWFLGGVATMAVVLVFQLGALADRDVPVAKAEWRRVKRLGILGLIGGGAAAGAYAGVAPPALGEALRSPTFLPYTIATALGGGLQVIGWALAWRADGRPPRRVRAILAGGLGLALVASGVMREATRLSAIDLSTLYAQHARAAQAQGLWLFVLFTVINGAVIAYAVRVARGVDLDAPVEP